MGQSKLEIIMSAVNQAGDEVQQLTSKLKETTSATKEHTTVTKENNDVLASAKAGVGDLIQQYTGLSPAMFTVGGAMVAVTAALKQSVDAAVELGDEEKKLMTLTGSTAEEAGRLIQASDDVGVSFDTLTRGIETAIRKGYKPTIEGLAEMGQKYRDIQDPIERSKYLMDTFGKSGADLAPILSRTAAELNNLADGDQKLGLVMGEEQVANVKKYEMALDGLNDTIEALKINIGLAVIPVFTDFLKTTTSGIEVGMKLTEVIGRQKQEWFDYVPIVGQVAVGVRMVNALTETHKELVEEETIAITQNTVNTQKFRQAEESATIEVKKSVDVLKTQQDVTQAVSGEMQKYSTQLLFNQAAQGLTKDAALSLAESMGLIDEKTQYATAQTAIWKKELEDNKITVEQYQALVAGLAGKLEGIQSKHVTIAIDYVETHSIGANGKPGGEVSDFTKDYSGNINNADNSPNAAHMQNDPLAGLRPPGKAIGGWAGGRTWVGENGPELVDLPNGSYVVNNYDMRTSTNYNLQAHYPQYQDPHAARNDLVALTMMRNSGAAKWA